MRRNVQRCPIVMLLKLVYPVVILACLLNGLYVFNQNTYVLGTRENLVIAGGYLVLLLFLHKVYFACAVGNMRVSELFLSQTLCNTISTLVTYFCICLYARKLLVPTIPLIVLGVQEVFSINWCLIANKLYFKCYTAPNTAILYESEETLARLHATAHFDTRFHGCRDIRVTDDNRDSMYNSIEDADVVFYIGESSSLATRLADFCITQDIKFYFMPYLNFLIMSGAEYTSRYCIPMMRLRRAGYRSAYRGFKRIMDICLSLIAIIVASPLMLGAALAIKLEDGGPVFYRQTRLTRDRKEFSILKFRSMRVNAEKDGVARLAGANDSRITKVGKFIRSCRIDELPQLINILQGDMSIVGPRPERPEIAREYEKELPEFALRLQVKAGLTGWAQVHGRYNTEPFNKLQMDLMYINQISLFTDLLLMMETVKILFMKESTEGIDAGQTTASRKKSETQKAS